MATLMDRIVLAGQASPTRKVGNGGQTGRAKTVPDELAEPRRGSLAAPIPPRQQPANATKAPNTIGNATNPVYAAPPGSNNTFLMPQAPTDPLLRMSLAFNAEKESANRRRNMPGFSASGLLGANPGLLSSNGIARKTLLGVS